jgi:Ca2+-binding RTX toxin-like protein
MATINGSSANNTLYGTSSADTLRGYGGNDYINGQGGNDTIDGGIGDDKVDGGAGNDTVRGGAGVDFVGGGTGNDTLYGDAGNDYLWGDAGFDFLFGGDGHDRMLGGEGANDLRGGTGDDTLVYELHGTAGSEASEYFGDGGTDTVHVISDGRIATDPAGEQYGTAEAWTTLRWDAAGRGWLGFASEVWSETPGAPNETVNASLDGIERATVDSRTKLIYNGSEVDGITVVGGNRDDRLFVGGGDETLSGGGGADGFRLRWLSYDPDGLGHDKILDYRPAEGDTIRTNGWLDFDTRAPVLSVTHREVGGSTVYESRTAGGDLVHTLEVVGVTGLAPDLIYDDFVLM